MPSFHDNDNGGKPRGKMFINVEKPYSEVSVPFSALNKARTEAKCPCPCFIGFRNILNPRVQGLIRLAPDSVGAKHAPPEHSLPFSASIFQLFGNAERAMLCNLSG